MQPNTEKKPFSLKLFTSKNILWWKIIYNETNEALKELTFALTIL